VAAALLPPLLLLLLLLLLRALLCKRGSIGTSEEASERWISIPPAAVTWTDRGGEGRRSGDERATRSFVRPYREQQQRGRERERAKEGREKKREKREKRVRRERESVQTYRGLATAATMARA
jgi:hypothetical protein